MPPERLISEISPYARVATALLPFLGALVARLVFGKNRLTQTVLSLATVWFAVSIWMAPYSDGLRQDLLNLRFIFR